MAMGVKKYFEQKNKLDEMYSILKGDNPTKMYQNCLAFIGATPVTSPKEIKRKFGILRKIFPQTTYSNQNDKQGFRKHLEAEVAFLIIKSMKIVKKEWEL